MATKRQATDEPGGSDPPDKKLPRFDPAQLGNISSLVSFCFDINSIKLLSFSVYNDIILGWNKSFKNKLPISARSAKRCGGLVLS